MSQFYTYTYVIGGVPEYVGKGRHTSQPVNANGERCLAHITRTPRTYWERHLSCALLAGKDFHIETNDHASEEAAFIEERRLIALHGRRDQGTGTLFNLTDGGEGHVGFKQSPELIERRISKIRGRVQSVEEKARRAAAMKLAVRPPMSEEAKQKHAERMSKTKWWTNGVVNKRSAEQPGPDFALKYPPKPQKQPDQGSGWRGKKRPPFTAEHLAKLRAARNRRTYEERTRREQGI